MVNKNQSRWLVLLGIALNIWTNDSTIMISAASKRQQRRLHFYVKFYGAPDIRKRISATVYLLLRMITKT